ncbi:MAG: hypothetical protein HYX27_05640 [Acidobacteria bacterium]|nr:hypothetical protein [Acidobacteriota bacterium]
MPETGECSAIVNESLVRGYLSERNAIGSRIGTAAHPGAWADIEIVFVEAAVRGL